MTKLIQSLEVKGFVKRATKTTDRRATLIQATAKGRFRLGKARQARILNLMESMQSLSKDEIEILVQAATIMEKLSGH